MRHLFVDTFYLIALSNTRDQWHRRVLAFSQCKLVHYPALILVDYLALCSRIVKKVVRSFHRIYVDFLPTFLPEIQGFIAPASSSFTEERKPRFLCPSGHINAIF